MVSASLVVGIDGATTLNGSSRALSTPEDREKFLSKRRAADCIIVGGRTADAEPYAKTPVPLIVLSHVRPKVIDQNPQAHWWNISPIDAITKARKEFGENIAVEGGTSFIRTLLETGSIDTLFLTVTPISGGESKIRIQEFTQYFNTIAILEKEGPTKFYTCTNLIK